MIDPAVIASIAASAANQTQPEGPVTLCGLVCAFVVVFGLAWLLVWGIGVFICG